MFDNKYPYTDFSQLNLDWFLLKFKELLEEQERVSGKVKDLDDTVKEFTDFVTNYFDNLDVQAEVNVKLNEMAADGTLTELIAPLVGDDIQTSVTGWLNDNVDPVGSAVIVDDTLTIEGAAADAKATGDAILSVQGVVNTALPTDTTLSGSGRAADAKATGDKIGEVENTLNGVKTLLIDDPINYAPDILEETPVLRTEDNNATLNISGNSLEYISDLDADRWVAFPLVNVLTPSVPYDYEIIFGDASTVYAVRFSKFATGSSSGYNVQSFTKDGNKYTLDNFTVSNPQDCFVCIMFDRYARDVSAVLNVYVHGDDSQHLKYKIVKMENLDDDLQGRAIPARNTNTNVFIGTDAGKNTEESLSDDGKYNTAVGVNAFKDNTTGDHCTAVGFQTLQKNTTGDGNTALGEDALYENTDGSSNTAVGAHTLQNATASGNTAIGTSALMNNTTGFFNTAIGNQAGRNWGTDENAITTDKYMTLLGVNTCKNVADELENSTAIGYAAKVSKSNQVVLGNTSVTELIFGTKKIIFNNDNTVTWENIS